MYPADWPEVPEKADAVASSLREMRTRLQASDSAMSRCMEHAPRSRDAGNLASKVQVIQAVFSRLSPRQSIVLHRLYEKVYQTCHRGLGFRTADTNGDKEALVDKETCTLPRKTIIR